MKRLKHDHVLQVFGANLDSNPLFLVLPLKSHGDVSIYLHNNPSANRRKLVRTLICRCMCCSCVYTFDTQCYDVSLGLAYLHENSVIHGDVKPVNMFYSIIVFYLLRPKKKTQKNILIDENGIPCLCDFGLSRIRTLLTQPPSTPLDEDKKPFGTLVYMSPEQMVYGTTNETSDVYSFGMTIYEVRNNPCSTKAILTCTTPDIFR